jgi:hypothetical protein
MLMKRFSRVTAMMAIMACLHPLGHGLRAQEGLSKSKAAGFFLGGGFDGNGITTSSDNVTESGPGGSFVIGYGFSRRWSLYSEASAATINLDGGGGTYSLVHLDVGTRIHFRTGPNVVVPFLQFAVSGRAMGADVDGTSVTGSGAGVTVGGGLNMHFTPAVAFSTAVTWTAGDFDKFQVGSQTISTNASVSATSARVHIGLVWFAQ